MPLVSLNSQQGGGLNNADYTKYLITIYHQCPCSHAGALVAVLSYLDFFSTKVQCVSKGEKVDLIVQPQSKEDSDAGKIKADARKFLYDPRVQAEVVVISMKTWDHKGRDGGARPETQLRKMYM
nr:cation-chloride cotransporter 1 [Tanacetum cinerariifolium]